MPTSGMESQNNVHISRSEAVFYALIVMTSYPLWDDAAAILPWAIEKGLINII